MLSKHLHVNRFIPPDLHIMLLIPRSCRLPASGSFIAPVLLFVLLLLCFCCCFCYPPSSRFYTLLTCPLFCFRLATIPRLHQLTINSQPSIDNFLVPPSISRCPNAAPLGRVNLRYRKKQTVNFQRSKLCTITSRPLPRSLHLVPANDIPSNGHQNKVVLHMSSPHTPATRKSTFLS